MSNINIQYKNVYVHVPKTAGLSMEGKPFIGKHGHENFYSLTQRTIFKDEYFKWAFVRNPYERLASAYFYTKKTHRKYYSEHVKDPDGTFESFVMNIELNLPDRPYDITKDIDWPTYLAHFYPQVYFTEHPVYKLDFIGRFENLKADWNHVVEKIKEISKSPNLTANLPHKNQSGTSNYMAKYTPRMKRMVYQFYKEDFKRFKYER